MIPFTPEEVEGTIGRRFRSVASRIPDHPAIRTSEAAFSFAELDAASDRLARLLIARRGTAEEPVALLAEEGIDGWSALLGILKAGKTIVLLSPGFDPPRLRAIWEDTGRPPILAGRHNRPLAESFSTSPESILEHEGFAAEAESLPQGRTGPDSPAVISYTTGSTGEPKGVVWSHRLVLHTARYNQERYHLSPSDRFAFASAYGFGAALIQSFTALLSGTTLCLGTDRYRDPGSLAEWLRREGVSLLHLTSFGLFRRPAGTVAAREGLPALRTVLLSGEVLYREDLERFRAFFPEGMEFSYRLAGSEALMMTEQPIPPDFDFPEDRVPAGFAVPDKELLLLDPDGDPAPPGKPGEIAIRSRYLADGYWGREELTRAKFLPDPAGKGRRIFLTGDMGRMLSDGSLLYLGRKDNIVRVRGFNIQLEAVETALRRLPRIREAAAAALNVRGGEKRLAAYLVAGSTPKPTIREIRDVLIRLLPAYMIPTVYEFLDELPRNPMGRPDRQALPPPGNSRPDLGAPPIEPRDEIERQLCELWQKLLEVDCIGVEDDFFLLGGDSLMSVNMVLEVEEAFGRTVPPAFFHDPTIANLARIWHGVAGSPGGTPGEYSGLSNLQPDSAPGAGAGAARAAPRKQIRTRGRYKRQTARVGPAFLSRPRRTVRLAGELLPLVLPLRIGSLWLSAWCRLGPVIRILYQAESELFRRWMESLGDCPDAPDGALSINLLANILWSKRYKQHLPLDESSSFLEALRRSPAVFFRDLAKVIDDAPPERFDRVFPVEGLAHLEKAMEGGRGVILVTYHGAANRYALAALPRRIGGLFIPTLSLNQALRLRHGENRRPGERKKPNEAALLANIAVEGHRLIKQGGILQVIPDMGYDASDGLPLTIAGYRLLVKPGFAELAVLSGADVIPYCATRRIDGSVCSRFFPPLERPPDSADRMRKVYALLDQYAAFVERSWKAAPESLLWQVIDTHMNRPADGG